MIGLRIRRWSAFPAVVLAGVGRKRRVCELERYFSIDAKRGHWRHESCCGACGGTGIVFDQRIYHGRTGSAAEGGHMTIDYRGPQCGCGKSGCIEVLCSGPAIARRARGRLAEPGCKDSIMMTLSGGNLERVQTETVAEAFRRGDSLAAEVLKATADFLTVWLGNVIDLLEPDVIIFGGGIAELMSAYFGHIREELSHWSISLGFALPKEKEQPLMDKSGQVLQDEEHEAAAL